MYLTLFNTFIYKLLFYFIIINHTEIMNTEYKYPVLVHYYCIFNEKKIPPPPKKTP